MRRNPNNIPEIGRDELNKPREPEVIKCPDCECSWFEQIEIHQFPKVHTVILGQRVQSASGDGFFGLRCIRCHEIIEPNIQLDVRGATRQKYDDFWDEMEDVKPAKGESL